MIIIVMVTMVMRKSTKNATITTRKTTTRTMM